MKNLVLFIAVFFAISVSAQNNTRSFTRGRWNPYEYQEVREYNDEETRELIKKMERTRSEEIIFRWDEVIASIQQSETNPLVIPEKCDKCHNDMIVVYFVSPAWTWKNLCGRAGDLIICPHCIRQLKFNCTIMN